MVISLQTIEAAVATFVYQRLSFHYLNFGRTRYEGVTDRYPGGNGRVIEIYARKQKRICRSIFGCVLLC